MRWENKSVSFFVRSRQTVILIELTGNHISVGRYVMAWESELQHETMFSCIPPLGEINLHNQVLRQKKSAYNVTVTSSGWAKRTEQIRA